MAGARAASAFINIPPRFAGQLFSSMAVLPITKGIDNPILRTKSAPVKKIDRAVKKLIADMIETMQAAEGLGIAAPQVGVNLRIYIARLNFNTPHEVIVPMMNAEFLAKSAETEAEEEGCLSIPGKFGAVRRSVSVTVKYLDERGKPHTLALSGLNAKVMQHETDHLNGILIADKMESEVSAEELTKRRRGKSS